MSVVGPSARYVYYFSASPALGVNLTSTNGQVGVFNPSGIDETLADLTGSASTTAAIIQTGHATSPDFVLPIWADSTLQGTIDDIHGTTAADRITRRILVVGWMGADVIGNYADVGAAYLKMVKPTTPHAMVTQLETTWTWENRVYPSVVLHELSAETADGDTEGDSVDNAASSANGGIGYWGYTALDLDGGTAFAPRVIDSADDATFGELIAFTAVTATTGGGQASSVTGTIERYLASDWDFTGTPGGSATCTFWIGFHRA